jgi:crotonobetaine/carnitine-CoA ligase
MKLSGAFTNKSGYGVIMFNKKIILVKRNIQFIKLVLRAFSWIILFMFEELRRGTLFKNLKSFFFSDTRGELSEEMSWAELLEERAIQVPEKDFLLYKNDSYTYHQMDQNANRTANFLLKIGGGKGKGIGILMNNSPRYLDVFFGAQKIGMYVLLINAKLIGDGLSYVVNHSDIEYLVIDAELMDNYYRISDQIRNIKCVIVNDIEEEAREHPVPADALRLSGAYGRESSRENPGVGYNKDDICLITYTSGTTGPPKGVVYRYRSTSLKKLCILSGFTLKSSDVYYTAFPLSHGNALFMTVTISLSKKATVALSRKFSAKNFWDDIRRYGATVFNAVGTIIPILLKQQERPSDRHHRVRYVLSSGCPADLWEKFEKRFGVSIFEAYSSVDGAGKGIINYGTAPVGSIGKPASSFLGKFRIIDQFGNDVPSGVYGELIYQVGDNKSRFEYYKNEQSTNEKIRDGWLYTGDLVRKDEKGYYYFVGRNTESMRRSGMNVSAYEVESVILKHPSIENVAVYAVPSDLSEDEIMASIKTVNGISLHPEDVIKFLGDKLAKFAIPRYIRMVDDLPMTCTYRIIKSDLKQEGITDKTYDVKSGMMISIS